jgi:hypothetical protein
MFQIRYMMGAKPTLVYTSGKSSSARRTNGTARGKRVIYPACRIWLLHVRIIARLSSRAILLIPHLWCRISQPGSAFSASYTTPTSCEARGRPLGLALTGRDSLPAPAGFSDQARICDGDHIVLLRSLACSGNLNCSASLPGPWSSHCCGSAPMSS